MPFSEGGYREYALIEPGEVARCKGGCDESFAQQGNIVAGFANEIRDGLTLNASKERVRLAAYRTPINFAHAYAQRARAGNDNLVRIEHFL